jgi:hypothetical protein
MLTLDRLQEVFGGNATSDEYHIGRHVANLFVTQTYEGQSDIHCKISSGSFLFSLTDLSRSPHSRPSHHGHPGVCVGRDMVVYGMFAGWCVGD